MLRRRLTLWTQTFYNPAQTVHCRCAKLTDTGFPARRLAARFARDERGATAILFSVALILLMLFVGLGVDVARLEKKRHDNQMFLDNARISALARDGRDVSADTVQTYYEANGGTGHIDRFDVQTGTSVVAASADISATIVELSVLNRSPGHPMCAVARTRLGARAHCRWLICRDKRSNAAAISVP